MLKRGESSGKELPRNTSGSVSDGASSKKDRKSLKRGDSHAALPTKQPSKNKLFGSVNKLREYSYDEEKAKEQQELDKFNENSCCGQIARNKRFEYITLIVIVFNALYLGYDVDYSAKYGKPDDLYTSEMPFGFILMENFFAIFFTAELVIRFVGYVYKSTFIKDKAFLFDLALVLMMVIETYPLAIMGSGGALKQFSILRLLRLARILRMGKLIRYFPELALIVKGMAAAVRSVGCAAILLMGVLYVFSIIFTNDYHQGWMYDEDIEDSEIQFLFGSLGKSMRHLFIMGTILDDITYCMNTIRSTEQIAMVFCFLVFVGISAFTLFNMLLGILCEVVQATGEHEKRKNKDKQLRDTITKFFITMDLDKDGTVSREEFDRMQDHANVMKALKKLDIDKDNLEKLGDVFFSLTPDEIEKGATAEKSMSSADCVAKIMKLRPGKGLNCCDFNYFKMKLTQRNQQINKYLDCVEWMVEELGGFDEDSDAEGENAATDAAKKTPGKDQDVGERGKPKRKSSNASKRGRSDPSSTRRPRPKDKKAAMRTLSALAHSAEANPVFTPPNPSRWHYTNSPHNFTYSVPATPLGITGTVVTPRSVRTPQPDDVVAFKLEALATKKRLKSSYLRDTMATDNRQMNNAEGRLATPYTTVTNNSGRIPLPPSLRNVADPEDEEIDVYTPPFSPQQFTMY